MSLGSTEKNKDILKKTDFSTENSSHLCNKQNQNEASYDISKLVFDVFKYKNNQHIFGISNATVSFLSLSKKKEIKKIYPTNKKIAFNQLEPEFKNILIQEFTDSNKQYLLKR